MWGHLSCPAKCHLQPPLVLCFSPFFTLNEQRVRRAVHWVSPAGPVSPLLGQKFWACSRAPALLSPGLSPVLSPALHPSGLCWEQSAFLQVVFPEHHRNKFRICLCTLSPVPAYNLLFPQKFLALNLFAWILTIVLVSISFPLTGPSWQIFQIPLFLFLHFDFSQDF